VLHYTAMASAEAAIKRLCDPSAEVSAHYVISRTGAVTQLVPEALRAWHAGAGFWAGQGDINSRSIGIELDNDGCSPFSEPLMAALEELMRGIMARHDIAPEAVIGHSDMAPGRKIDPGPRFDWLRLERAGLARPRGGGPVPEQPEPDAFRAAVASLGYEAEVPDAVLLETVRHRFRPEGRGALSRADFAALPEAMQPKDEKRR
jgi:N-acetylmuramoyl-L-alanine amidase